MWKLFLGKVTWTLQKENGKVISDVDGINDDNLEDRICPKGVRCGALHYLLLRVINNSKGDDPTLGG